MTDERYPWIGRIPRRPDPDDPDPERIYAIGTATHVKIGRSGDVDRRRQELQAASPLPLGILATCPGGSVGEALLHRYLAASRSHGEWYAHTDDVAAVISAMTTISRAADRPDEARALLVDTFHAAVGNPRRHASSPQPVDNLVES